MGSAKYIIFFDKKNDQGEDGNKDKELNDLLDSALKDFNSANSMFLLGEEKRANEPSDEWNDQFFADQMKMLNEQMQSLFSPGGTDLTADQINLGFQKMIEAAAKVTQGDVATPEEPKDAESIKEALKVKRFTNFTSNKELLEKYPKYLEDNASKLDASDKETYEQQLELFKVFSKELEAEKPDDTPDIKNEKFKNVLDSIQKLHEYGQPPEELIGAVSASLPGLKEVCKTKDSFRSCS